MLSEDSRLAVSVDRGIACGRCPERAGCPESLRGYLGTLGEFNVPLNLVPLNFTFIYPLGHCSHGN